MKTSVQVDAVTGPPNGPGTRSRRIPARPRSREARDAAVGWNRGGADSVRPSMFQLGVFAALLALTACIGSAASLSTTATASAVQVAPPTTIERATSTATVATTVAAPTSTFAAPTTTSVRDAPTSVDDELAIAIDRAQAAMRNCYEVAPGCDETELESAFVGVQLDGFRKRSADKSTFANVDGLAWTPLGAPTLKGNELAIATFCAFDPMVVTSPDGRIDDGEYYFLQEWHLVPVGDTWKLSEIINQNEPTTDSAACDG